jgi:hypothetical protein
MIQEKLRKSFSTVQTQNPNADDADLADLFTKNIGVIRTISEIRDKKESSRQSVR